MSDQFDKKLVNRINEVFDNFEDDSANEGWTELRKRMPNKSEHRPAIWWFSSAAAILLVCGLWFFSTRQAPEKQEEKITKTIKPKPFKGIDSKNYRLGKESIIEPDKKNYENAESLVPVKNKIAFRDEETPKQVGDDQSSLTSLSKEIKQADESLKYESAHDLTLTALVGDQSIKSNSELIDSSNLKTALQVADNVPVNQLTTNNTVIYPSDPSHLVASEKRKENPKKYKNIILGFFAGSYFNYAKGSQTSVNSGVGISSEIKLSKKLKISTGVSLAQNSLKYNQLIPQEAAMSFRTSDNKLQFDQYYTNAALSPGPISYSINSYNAKLLGLDIPMNLKYTLLEKKNTIYLSTGISSNLFINESYTYTFDYQMTGNNSLNVPDQQSSSNFQSFDFGRVLNFSLGIDHPLNGQTGLSFEPFIKYPLSGLGAHDLRFGAAGINLKLNFNRSKQIKDP